jgi:hypothetical protein
MAISVNASLRRLTCLLPLLLQACGDSGTSITNFEPAPTPSQLPLSDGGHRDMGVAQRLAAVELVEAKDPIQAEIKRFTAEVRGMFEEERFDELDRLERELVTSKALFPDGKWKLTRFYWAFAERYDRQQDQWVADWHRFVRWIEYNPTSLAARTGLGDFLISYAWYGKRSAKGKAGERLFNERLALAHEVMSEARKLPDQDPFWYMSMARVALGQKWPAERYDALVEEGLTLEPSYWSLATSRPYSLLPKWDGAPGEWEKWADREYVRPGGLGAEGYARILTMMPDFYNNVFAETSASWPKTREGLLILREKYPDSGEIINYTAKLASLAGDRDLAREMFSLMGNTYVESVWKSPEQVIQFRHWAETGAWDRIPVEKAE